MEWEPDDIVRESLPPPDHRTWRQRAFSKRALGTVGATLAVVLFLVASYIHIFGLPSITTPLPHIALTWYMGTIPSGAANALAAAPLPNFDPGIAIAPSDGNTAYLCIAPKDAESVTEVYPEIWVTHDRAAHWTHVSDLPTQPMAVASCGLTIDTLDPAILVAQAMPSTGPGPEESFASFDGGRTWQTLTSPQAVAVQEGFATWGHTTYTMSNIGLYRSTDGMRTWQTVTSGIVSAGTIMRQYWVNPGSGNLLAWTEHMSTSTSYLWSSQDQGARWRKISTQRVGEFDVQQPRAGHPWVICGISYVAWRNTFASVPGGIRCSSDGGRTWKSYPAPTPTSQTQSIFVWSISTSGDIIAVDFLTTGKSSMLRLVISTRQWQALGAIPSDEDSILYVALPSPGVLWAVPMATTIFRPVADVFTADYPA
ncbi:MAG: hypothetical protein ACLQUY_22510 [Ktedonobacterales bacterium]